MSAVKPLWPGTVALIVAAVLCTSCGPSEQWCRECLSVYDSNHLRVQHSRWSDVWIAVSLTLRAERGDLRPGTTWELCCDARRGPIAVFVPMHIDAPHPLIKATLRVHDPSLRGNVHMSSGWAGTEPIDGAGDYPIIAQRSGGAHWTIRCKEGASKLTITFEHSDEPDPTQSPPADASDTSEPAPDAGAGSTR